jgi:hypothetical protein
VYKRGNKRFHGYADAGRPGGVGDGGNSGNGTVEEDSDEGGAADEDGQAADERVVAPDPALHPLLWRAQRPADEAPLLSLQKTKENRVAEPITAICARS